MAGNNWKPKGFNLRVFARGHLGRGCATSPDRTHLARHHHMSFLAKFKAQVAKMAIDQLPAFDELSSDDQFVVILARYQNVEQRYRVLLTRRANSPLIERSMYGDRIQKLDDRLQQLQAFLLDWHLDDTLSTNRIYPHRL